ncbi:MAG: chromosome segregation protein SMC [Ignavibacteria bacterium]
MYLSKLEIFGFKSFPEKTVIEFDSGVSAIVGPNGSGKSNIVDAIRWVLGEQGDKVLRSEKREDIVFSGTKFRKPLSIAEVAITIQNNKNILPTEYTEVQIARRFFRNGETEYYLNGTKVRLKDIRNLFVDTGIGPDAYSVIELKMVETILSSVKNERRKMFEEAAGVVSYKYNRDTTLKRLESVKQDISRVNDIIREKQRNVSALERQVKRNEEARKTYEELRNLEIILYTHQYCSLINEIAEIKDHEVDNLELKDRLLKEIKEYDQTYDSFLSESQTVETSIKETSLILETKKRIITDLEKIILVNNEKLSNLHKNIERLKLENENLTRNIENNRGRRDAASENLEVLKRSLEISEVSLREKKNNLDETTNIMTDKKNEIYHLGLKLKEIIKKVNDSKNLYEKYKIRLENNYERLKKISDINENNLKTIEKLENEKNLLTDKLETVKTQKKKTENELSVKISLKNNLNSKLDLLNQSLTDKQQELQKIESKIAHLVNLKESFEDYVEGIQYLLKEKKSDFVCTVLSMLNVEDKFKVAIETALGEVSNYLVLKNSAQLTKIIDELNEKDKGKVTFILQDKLSLPYFHFDIYGDDPDFITDKGVYGFADKLVEITDPTYKDLVSYLLDEYVIVDTLDTAFKYARDNYYKFITLDGDIVTESFVRAGGKTNEENLKMGRDQRIEELKKRSLKLQGEISEIKEQINQLTDKINSIDIASLTELISELGKELLILNKDITVLTEKISATNTEIEQMEKEYQSTHSETDDLNLQVNTIINQVSKLENEQSNAEKELAFLSDEFNEIEQNYRLHLEEYNNFNLEVIKLKNEIKNEESSLQRAISNIQFQTDQINRNQKHIIAFEEEHQNLLRDNETKNNQLKEFYAELGKVQEQQTLLQHKYDEIRQKQNQIDNQRRGKRSQFDKVSQALVNAQIKIKENEIKAENLKNIIKNKYEVELTNDFNALKNDVILSTVISEYTTMDGVFDVERVRNVVEELTEKLKKFGGGYQQIVWDDFENEKKELENLITQRDDLHEAEKNIIRTIERINNEAKEKFLNTFEQIRQNFINIFKELFSEGDEANLKLVYEQDDNGRIIEDPLEAKIEIVAKPRGKKPTSIELLSQGEKTLVAIALLFAIYLVKPSPFCVLDEVDAPLDSANLERFNKMIRKFSNNTQFIIITHNERTMEKADRLYGVTMQEPGVTTIVETVFKQKTG